MHLFVDNLTRCSHPGIPINGKLNMTSDFSIGSLVEFECNRGYVMIGDSEQECLFFLQWSGNGAPKCIGWINGYKLTNSNIK